MRDEEARVKCDHLLIRRTWDGRLGNHILLAHYYCTLEGSPGVCVLPSEHCVLCELNEWQHCNQDVAS